MIQLYFSRAWHQILASDFEMWKRLVHFSCIFRLTLADYGTNESVHVEWRTRCWILIHMSLNLRTGKIFMKNTIKQHIRIYSYCIRRNYRIQPYLPSINYGVSRTGQVLYKMYALSTDLNRPDMVTRFKWLPKVYAFIKNIGNISNRHH